MLSSSYARLPPIELIVLIPYLDLHKHIFLPKNTKCANMTFLAKVKAIKGY